MYGQRWLRLNKVWAMILRILFLEEKKKPRYLQIYTLKEVFSPIHQH